MNGSKLLLDSNICIYLSKRALLPADFIKPTDFVAVSIITYMETLGYNFDNEDEERYLNQFFAILTMLPITEQVANRVIAYRKIKRIKLPDAILLATARENKCRLVTRNLEDFEGIDPHVTLFNPF